MNFKVSVHGKSIPATTSNLSDEELADFVRGYFPELGGALEDMLVRFEKLAGIAAEDQQGRTVNCPACGTVLEITRDE